jgi:threonine-phosphate decarboxylase
MHAAPTKPLHPTHGGDLEELIRRYGADPPWLDFSANINPDGPPEVTLQALGNALNDAAFHTEYPYRLERELRHTLAEKHGIEPESLVLAGGSTPLIDAFMHTVKPKRIFIPQPAFSEYARAVSLAEAEIGPYPLTLRDEYALSSRKAIAALSRARVDACILTNPHNPSGSLTSLSEMQTIAGHCNAHAITLLVDEAFINYCPAESLLKAGTPRGRVVVMRSLTKFYGMPGMRVGYGVATPAFAQHLQARIPSWPISAMALVAASSALSDQGYAEQTIRRNENERTRLAQHLRDRNFEVMPSDANFLLCISNEPVDTLIQNLAEHHHISVRDCRSYDFSEASRAFRIAVRTRDENARLLAAIDALR